MMGCETGEYVANNQQQISKVPVKYGIQLELRPDQAEKIAAADIPGDSMAEKLTAVANYLVGDHADGAVTLDLPMVKQLKDVLGEEFTPEDLLAACSASKSIRQGSRVISWLVDPSYEEPLQMIAEQQGMDVDTLCQNMMDFAMEQGWMYDLNPQPKQLLITEAQHEWLKEAMGRDTVTGADLIDYLHAKVIEEDTPAAAPIPAAA